jgi:hypothetical protein
MNEEGLIPYEKKEQIVGFIQPDLQSEADDIRRQILEREAVRDHLRAEVDRHELQIQSLTGQLFDLHKRLKQTGCVRTTDRKSIYPILGDGK